MITYSVNSVKHIPKTWKFPAGEVGVSAHFDNNSTKTDLVKIFAHLTSSDEVMKLLMLTDALKRQYPNAQLELHLGYIPYGRQDRVCSEGESLSIKVFANLINAQEYSRVVIFDPHSDVTPALLNNCQVITQREIFNKLFAYKISSECRDVIIAPDFGASKKVLDIYNDGHFKEMMVADKVRDLKTGYITDFDFTGDVEGKHCVVVDDILDGGATFTLIGNALVERGAKSLSLVVTHGIFSKGTEPITSIYDNVYTTNSYQHSRVGLVEGVEYTELI